MRKVAQLRIAQCCTAEASYSESNPIASGCLAVQYLLAACFLERVCIRVVDNSASKQLGPTDRLRIRRVQAY